LCRLRVAAAPVMDLSGYVFEVLRKDEEFILYRGQSIDVASQAAFASRLRPLRRAPGDEVEAAENRGRDVGSAESGYGTPLILGEGNVSQEPRRSPADAGRSRVLVLSPAIQQPTPESLKWLEHAYSFKEELDPAWATRPIALTGHWNRPVLVLQDPGGVPLDQLLGRPLDLAFSLRLAIGLSSAIDQLHRRDIIHKDIKPANVLVDSVTGRCWLMGFGIASRLPRERQAPEPTPYSILSAAERIKAFLS
jgi:Protein kinase domain